MRLIALVNESDKLTGAHLKKIAGAITWQFCYDFCPEWHAPTIVCYPTTLDKLQPWTPRIVFLPHSDAAGALGYHDVGPDGVPYGRVFVDDILAGGGQILTDSGDCNSVSGCASHEALEAAADPDANQYVQGPSRPEGDQWALEVGDPCQGFSYVQQGVSVSDFAGPGWFGRPGKIDHLGKIQQPFTIAPGGYAIVRSAPGNDQQIYGVSKHLPHPASRLARRRLLTK